MLVMELLSYPAEHISEGWTLHTTDGVRECQVLAGQI